MCGTQCWKAHVAGAGAMASDTGTCASPLQELPVLTSRNSQYAVNSMHPALS